MAGAVLARPPEVAEVAEVAGAVPARRPEVAAVRRPTGIRR
ncbi:hypothetical protein AB0O32_36255 [Streptomyces rubiginosohelvolus]